jgi:hypothetical protein
VKPRFQSLPFKCNLQRYHPSTTREIRALCEDLGVLGRVDFKLLLKVGLGLGFMVHGAVYKLHSVGQWPRGLKSWLETFRRKCLAGPIARKHLVSTLAPMKRKTWFPIA